MMDQSTTLQELTISVGLYNKPLESIPSIVPLDRSIFDQLEQHLSINGDLSVEGDIDWESPLLLFLLEHVPLYIDLHSLASTEGEHHQHSSIVKKYKPQLFPSDSTFVWYPSEAQAVLQHLFERMHVKSLEQFILLKQSNESIYSRCLHKLTPFLLKTTYDKYPIAIHSFVHLVKAMCRSELSDAFESIFPVCLMALDDPSIDIKLISLDLLAHLQRHCTSTDLSMFNRSIVVMYGLEQNLHRRNDRSVLFECLLASTYRWLSLLEPDIYSGKHQFARSSQIVERLIRDALLEVNLDYRRLLVVILRSFITRLELFAVRHLTHLLELIEDCTEHRLLRSDALQLLLVTLQTLTPRIDAHRQAIMKIIMRCLFKIVHDNKNDSSMFVLLGTCTSELRLCTPQNYVRDALQSLIDTSLLDLSYRQRLQSLRDVVESQS